MPQTRTKSKKLPTGAIRAVPFADHPDHETIWAIAAGPGGLIHIAVCCETIGGGTVHLYAYDTATGKKWRALDVAQAIGEYPANGHAAHGKVHFALCPSEDGYVYAATHASTPPLGDHIWDARTMWNDHEKSFTGSHFFRYDPRTGECTDHGILFPNEGIAAMALDDSLGRLVGATYPRGHVFFIDKDGTNFLDAGRFSACYPLCIVLDGRGYAFGSDSYGYILRMDLSHRTVETLISRLPRRGGTSGRYDCMCDAVLGPDGAVYCLSYTLPNMFRFKPVHAGPVCIEDLGMVIPKYGQTLLVRGIALGKDGKLYGCLYDHETMSGFARLVRFDPRTRRGEDLGDTAVHGASRRYWRCVRGMDGRLYAGECGWQPVSMLVIDPDRIR